MAPSAVFERIRKLEERGVILGYAATVDPSALGIGLLAYVSVRGDETSGTPVLERALAAIPEVQEIHHIAGEDCFLIKVRTASTEALGRLLRDRIAAISQVRSTRTTIVLSTIKETTALPIPEGASRV